MAEKKTKKTTAKKATVKKVASTSVDKPITQDKATELYTKRNKASGLDKEVHPLAMWGFIASLSPLVIVFIPFLNFFTVFLPPVGIILSAIGLSKIKKEPKKYKGRGFALAGIIVGGVTIVLGTVLIVVGLAFIASNPDILATLAATA